MGTFTRGIGTSTNQRRGVSFSFKKRNQNRPLAPSAVRKKQRRIRTNGKYQFSTGKTYSTAGFYVMWAVSFSGPPGGSLEKPKPIPNFKL